MDSQNPVSPDLVTLVPQLMGGTNLSSLISTIILSNPKYFIDQAAPRFELGVKDLQSPALPLGHAAKKSDLKSRKEQVFIHIFLLKPFLFFFSFILNLILLRFFESFSKKIDFCFFLDPVSLILLDGFYLKTHIANTRKLPFSFYSIEMTKEKKWISSRGL